MTPTTLKRPAFRALMALAVLATSAGSLTTLAGLAGAWWAILGGAGLLLGAYGLLILAGAVRAWYRNRRYRRLVDRVLMRA